MFKILTLAVSLFLFSQNVFAFHNCALTYSPPIPDYKLYDSFGWPLKQPNHYTCGPTSLAIGLNALGVTHLPDGRPVNGVTLYEFLMRLDPYRTRPDYATINDHNNLVLGARLLGLFSQYQFGVGMSQVLTYLTRNEVILVSWDMGVQKPIPVLGNWTEGHWSVFFRTKNGFAELLDPWGPNPMINSIPITAFEMSRFSLAPGLIVRLSRAPLLP